MPDGVAGLCSGAGEVIAAIEVCTCAASGVPHFVTRGCESRM